MQTYVSSSSTISPCMCFYSPIYHSWTTIHRHYLYSINYLLHFINLSQKQEKWLIFFPFYESPSFSVKESHHTLLVAYSEFFGYQAILEPSNHSMREKVWLPLSGGPIIESSVLSWHDYLTETSSYWLNRSKKLS